MTHHLRRLKSAARPVSAVLIACLLMVTATAQPAHAGSDTFTTPVTNATWTAPAGVTSITVECWGGGGGGGSDTSSNNGGGGGGGGGAYAVATYTVVPGSQYTYTVGAAGSGGTTTGTNASAGGVSSFHGGSCIAPGGAAGGNGTGAGAGALGAGGAATGSPAFSGGSGAVGQSSSGGGGGGSAGPGPSGTGAPGNDASGSTAGAALAGTAGSSGAGGAGISGGTGANAPTTGPGGGGGGGEYSGSGGGGSRAGGNGSAGKIVITYKQTPSLSITNSPVTYNGSPRAVTLAATAGGTVAGSFSNIRYNGSTTVPTTAGTYPIVADFTPSDPANYNSITNVAVGDFVINKATPTLSVTNSPQTYDGTAKPATVVGSVAGAPGNIKYGGAGTAPTTAGTYAVTADFTPSDTTNYNSLTDAAAGNFVINKATPTLTVTNSPVTYNGAAQAATLASSTLGTISNVRYNGNTAAPTNAASYPMTANFVPSDTANYNSLTGASAGTFVINKATPTLAVTNSPATYSGTAKTATIAVTGPAGTVGGSTTNIRYDNSTTQPINAGTYVVTANFTPSDTTNYNSVTNGGAGNFVINQATTTTTVSCSGGPFTYTGAAITPTCTAAATGVGGLNATGLAVTFANNTNAGTATASAAYAGTANYLPSNGSTTFTINKATPTLAITNSPQVFDATAKTAAIAASATAGTVNGTYSNILYNSSATAPTDAGSYTVKVDFVPSDTANYNSLTNATAGTFVINKAASATAITCDPGPFAFDGTAQTPCSASVTGPGLSESVAVVYTNNTNAGTATANATYAASTNYLGSSDSKNFTIDKAATITAVTCTGAPFTYTGAAQTPCAAVVTGPGGLNQTGLTVTYAGNTNAGTASASASYGGAANYFGSSDNTTFTIDKAIPVLAVTNSPVAYDGTAKTANIVATATAGTVDGTLANVEYSLSPTAPTNAGTYAVTADFTPIDLTNYNTVSGAGAGNFTIGKAATSTALTCDAGPFAFDGNSQTPCTATVTGPGSLSEAVPVVYADNINAGTATANADYAGTANYLASSDSTTFAIDKAATITTVTCAAGPFTYTGAAIEPCAAGVTGPGGLNQTALAVTYANNVNAGTASASASYAGAANYLPSGDSTTFPIGKATPVLAVTNSPQVFDGAAKAATIAASGPAGTVAGTFGNIQYNTSSTEPTNAGSYGVTADFTPDDLANYNTLSGGSAGSFVIQPAATTTTVTCAPGPFVYSGTAFEPCTAVATGPAGLNLAVAVVYSDNTNAGLAAASANYAGSSNYFPSSDDATFTIAKADPTLSITNSPATYDGTAKAAAVSGSTAGTASSIKYDGSATEPIGAGSYAVTADFVPDDAANYNAIGGAAAGSFVINKANPTLSITNSPADYDGTPKAANVVGSVPGTASNLTYNTVGAAPTNAGTYAVNADFAPEDTANYNTLTGAVAGNFVIQKAGVPTLSVSNSPLVFNGLPQAAVVVGSVPGTPSNVLYNGSSTVPTDAGSYVITADFAPDDTVNYDTVTGETAGTLVIEKAPTTTAVSCGAGPFTYSAAEITPCTAVVTGPGGLNQPLTVVYANNINAGTASASAGVADSANYLASSDTKSFEIGKADPTLAVTNSPAAYDGTAKTAAVVGSVPGTVSNIRYNGSANAPIDAGTYAITADFVPDDANNYNTLAGAAAGNFVIEKAGVPVLSVTNSPQVFTGAAQAAVVVGSVPGTVSNIRYDGSPSAPAGAGSYVITADFVPDDTVNYDSITGASAGSFTISRAATTTSIDCGTGPYTYTGAAITPCTATATGPGGLSEAVTVSYSSNTNVGTAAAGANYAGGSDYLPSSAATSFTIAKAATTTTISCGSGPFAYTGALIEPCAATVTGPGGLSHAVPVTYADNLNAGTASVSATFSGGINYLPSSGTATFTIAPAATTTSLVCSDGPFTYNGAAFTPCAAEVSGPDGLNEVLPVVYADNTNAGTATASASYAGAPNYAASSATTTFAIAKAPTVTTVTCTAGPFTVTGSAIEPCTASVTGAAGLNQPLVVTYVNNTNAGTATASASYAGSVNYLGSSDTEVFVIGQAVESTVFVHLPYMSK